MYIAQSVSSDLYKSMKIINLVAGDNHWNSDGLHVCNDEGIVDIIKENIELIVDDDVYKKVIPILIEERERRGCDPSGNYIDFEKIQEEEQTKLNSLINENQNQMTQLTNEITTKKEELNHLVNTISILKSDMSSILEAINMIKQQTNISIPESITQVNIDFSNTIV